MNVTIAVDSQPGADDSRDPRHRAEVYPSDRPEAEPLMVTGWNFSAGAAKQHAFQWARMNGHIVDNPPY
ncbi:MULTISPECIES: CDP-diacylglycerol pyrophosphatase [Herbaspirillum]|uniref:CDP-diacylglycerol pyrophosphatase n=2 Tax=Herbaspirillum huttiense TaxID=863372 RepID=A0AAJ2H558_9BURK|nr:MULTISPECIES: CDP-diacylglycerol pyrophosphatase [Herbaspirillum]MDR9836964.1 CDP-diacylglycerol pyrophosphatase [Herbaspirillum huttiense]